MDEERVSSSEQTTTLAENPLLYFFDTLLITLFSALLPIPIANYVASHYKMLMIWFMATIAGFFLIIMLLLFALLFSPIFAISHITSFFSLPGITVTSLPNYHEQGFQDTSAPLKNPLGGEKYTNSLITLDFHAIDIAFFKSLHTGIDLIPSPAYYLTNEAFRKTGKIIIFATMNGQATVYQDQYGANVIDIYNNQHTILTRFVHLERPFIASQQSVYAGEPIGIMGQTGIATGAHLHYEIQVKINGTFTPVDPKLFIQ